MGPENKDDYDATISGTAGDPSIPVKFISSYGNWRLHLMHIIGRDEKSTFLFCLFLEL